MRSPDDRGFNVFWQGRGASPGTAVGTAVVIQTEKDFLIECNDDSIIVARHATPAIFPLLLRARGAVSEAGGLLSHLAVLAREICKPCVTGVAGILGAVQTGDRIRIDGANGTVSLINDDGRPQPPKTSTLENGPSQYVPVMQFGLFSPAFEFAQPYFSLQIAISVAALISLPTRVGRDVLVEYVITEREVLLAKTSLNELVNSLCDRLENRSLDFGELKRSYERSSAAQCWMDLESEFASPYSFRSALREYFRMNRITWAAALVRDAPVSRYWTFLTDAPMNAEPSTRRELFLNSLITRGRSYILSCLVDEQGKSHKWSKNVDSFAGLQDFQIEAGRARTSDAREQRQRAIHELRRLLNQEDFDRAQLYMNVVTDLVEIMERKNTDLHRCEELLFGNDARASQSAASLGLSWENASDQQTMVESALALFEGDDGFYYPKKESLNSASAKAGI